MKNALTAFIVGQFGNPHGLVGKLAGWVMANRDSNRRRNLWTVRLMDLRPNDHVLEIGHGPGLALTEVCRQVTEGAVVGIDRSPVMRDMAATRNRDALAAGRLMLTVGSIEQPQAQADPALQGPFDHIYAVNVVMFWKDPVGVLRNLQERLAPGGRIYLTFQPRTGERTDAAAAAAGERFVADMRAAGLRDAYVETFREVSPAAVCVIGANDTDRH
jgi:SAM-dependent methyltransferase